MVLKINKQMSLKQNHFPFRLVASCLYPRSGDSVRCAVCHPLGTKRGKTLAAISLVGAAIATFFIGDPESMRRLLLPASLVSVNPRSPTVSRQPSKFRAQQTCPYFFHAPYDVHFITVQYDSSKTVIALSIMPNGRNLRSQNTPSRNLQCIGISLEPNHQNFT